jgi:hypothetical protein
MALGKLRAAGRVVIALGWLDSVIMVYDADTAVELTRYRAVPRVTSLAIDLDGEHLAYGTAEGRIMISKIESHLDGVRLFPRREIRERELIEKLGFHPKADTLVYAITQSAVVVANTFGTVFWRLTWRGTHPLIYTQMFNPVRDEFLICTQDGIRIYDVSTADDGRFIRMIRVQECKWGRYSPCGNYILVIHRDTMGVWANSAGGDNLFEIPDIGSHAVAWFCNDEKGLCFVVDPDSDQVRLLNFTAERKRFNL